MLDGTKKVTHLPIQCLGGNGIKKKKARRYARIGKSVEFLEHSWLWECAYNQFSK